MKTLIRGGMVVTPQEVTTADVLLSDGIIAKLGPDLSAPGAEIVDATGKYVLPGGVDAHTHVTLNIDAVRGADIYYAGTVPAAAGGTTTIIEHLGFAPAGRSVRDQLLFHRREADSAAVVDYAFHGLIQGANGCPREDTAACLNFFRARDCASVKVYTTYDGRLDDDSLLLLLRMARERGLLPAVHAERHEPIMRLRAEFKAKRRGEPMCHARSRPAECEAGAVRRVLELAAQAGDAPVYIVHLSTAAGLEEITKARAAGQRNIFVETCTQYLVLTEERYAHPVEGLKYIMAPPLRTRDDVEALWQGVADGRIQTVATDHCAYTLRDKEHGRGDFTACPGGAPGVEERMNVLFSEGVAKKRISPQRFAELCCSAPARLFGLAPRKGVLAPGSDADVVILDPVPRRTLRAAGLHGLSDYSIYEGLDLTGRIDAVYLRGRLIAAHGSFLGGRGEGRLLKQRRADFG